ncbi:ribonuclease H-like domain-containing protein [Tanacetum coccineum]|uniref:Ribonuclease H-like domain-containing protein n=1 Tax=Tanacetum coccineum TaxID=301880 RepID=A0ABQ5F4X5_9ASTR
METCDVKWDDGPRTLWARQMLIVDGYYGMSAAHALMMPMYLSLAMRQKKIELLSVASARSINVFHYRVKMIHIDALDTFIRSVSLSTNALTLSILSKKLHPRIAQLATARGVTSQDISFGRWLGEVFSVVVHSEVMLKVDGQEEVNKIGGVGMVAKGWYILEEDLRGDMEKVLYYKPSLARDEVSREEYVDHIGSAHGPVTFKAQVCPKDSIWPHCTPATNVTGRIVDASREPCLTMMTKSRDQRNLSCVSYSADPGTLSVGTMYSGLQETEGFRPSNQRSKGLVDEIDLELLLNNYLLSGIAFSVQNSKGSTKGYDKFQSLLSQLEIHGAGVSTEDANQKFFRVFENDVKALTAHPLARRICPQLDHEDLEQLDEFDLEEMDLKWQVALISMRMKKFYKKTGRKLQFDAKEPVGFDKTKVECYSYHKTGHFARDCRTKGNQDSRRRDAWNSGNKDGRRSGKQEDSKSLVTIDGEVFDWPVTKNKKKISLDALQYFRLRTQSDANIEILAYTQALKKVEAQLVAHQQSQLWYEEKIMFMKIDLDDKTDVLHIPTENGVESDSEDEHVSLPTEEQETPSFANQQAHDWHKPTVLNTSLMCPLLLEEVKMCNRRTKGKGPTWLFDLDYLTDSMNYQPVRSENQANKHAGPKEANQTACTEDNIDAGDSVIEAESAQDYFVLPIWSSYTSTVKSSKANNAGEEPTKHPDFKQVDKEDQVFLEDLKRLKRQEQDANVVAEALRKEFAQETEDFLLQAGAAKASSTNIVNTASTPISTVSLYGELSFTNITPRQGGNARHNENGYHHNTWCLYREY